MAFLLVISTSNNELNNKYYIIRKLNRKQFSFKLKILAQKFNYD